MTLIDRKIPDEIAGTLLVCSHEVIFLSWVLPHSSKDGEGNTAR